MKSRKYVEIEDVVKLIGPPAVVGGEIIRVRAHRLTIRISRSSQLSIRIVPSSNNTYPNHVCSV
jgi:hypothetical protein